MSVAAPARPHSLHLDSYTKAVVTFVDDDGYPMSVPADFRLGDRDDSVFLRPIESVPNLMAGRRVTVIFSQIRPVEGYGYVDRRYVTVEGVLRERGEVYEVRAEKVSGWDESEVAFFEYCERSVGRARRYLERLSTERGERVSATLSLPWKAFLATRVPFLSATFIPVALGAVIARWRGYSAWWLSIAALVGASLIHLGLNMANDYFDTASGADEANVNPTPFSGGSRVLQYGLVSPRAMLAWSAGLIAAGAAIGVVLSLIRGPFLLALGAVGLFLAIFYSAPPIKLAYRGLGDIAVALGFGPIVVVGSYFVASGSLGWDALYGSIPIAILVMLILYVNQVPDRRGDALAGKRTVAVRFSRKTIIRGYLLSVGLAFASIPVGVLIGIMPVTALVALAPAPLALIVYRGLADNYDSPYDLMPTMSRNIALHAVVGILLIASYVAAIFLGL
jgi:1,4-dihydroxy-2-naphthoate octaprenyltransferase